jgi:PAS domain-containing protein
MGDVFDRLKNNLQFSTAGRWLFAAAFTLAATLLVRLLTAKQPDPLYSPPFLAATALIAWFSGPIPAAFSAIASALTLEFYVIQNNEPDAAAIRLLTFLSTAALFILLIYKYQRSTEVLARSEERAKLGESALQKTLHELATVIDTAPVAIYSIDTTGLVSTWSAVAERIFGYSHEEAIRKYPPFVPPEDLPDYLGLVAALRNGE